MFLQYRLPLLMLNITLCGLLGCRSNNHIGKQNMLALTGQNSKACKTHIRCKLSPQNLMNNFVVLQAYVRIPPFVLKDVCEPEFESYISSPLVIRRKLAFIRTCNTPYMPRSIPIYQIEGGPLTGGQHNTNLPRNL